MVAAGLSDIDDRFSVRIMNLIYTYIGFFITAASVQLLFPYPMLFALGLIASCIGWIFTRVIRPPLRDNLLWMSGCFGLYHVGGSFI